MPCTGFFRSLLEAAKRDSVAATDAEAAEQMARGQAAWEDCCELALRESILDAVAEELEREGAAGESRLGKTVYLAVTSRVLERPVSVKVNGPSAAGKSYMTQKALGLFPPSAYYVLTAMSEHALAYGEEPLSHRMLVIYEASGMTGDVSSYLIRSLLSEGHIRYETVEKTPEGLRARLIERPGPTGLIVTTTQIRLHPENETRLLSVPVDDSRDQTKRVMRSLASEQPDGENDVRPWWALQEWLESGERRVTIPFADRLVDLIPPTAVRLRRDFGLLLSLIRAHALLHRATRECDSKGRIVATPQDYAVVRELVADLVGEAVQVSASKKTRKTVQAVAGLLAEGKPHATNKEIALALDLDKSATSRRVRDARTQGYLENLEEQKGRPARIVLGDPLPGDEELLPRPELLHGCTADGGDTHLDPHAENEMACFGCGEPIAHDQHRLWEAGNVFHADCAPSSAVEG
jgi:hypothetical protein